MWLGRISMVLRFLVWVVWVGECCAALTFVVSYLIPASPTWAAAIFGILFVAGAMVAARWIRPTDSVPFALEGFYPQLSRAILGSGVLLRILWVAAVPPIQISDFDDYLQTSRRLLETGSYFGTVSGFLVRAFRPPGYPLFLAGWLKVVGDHSWTPALANLVLYVLSALLVEAVALQTAGRKAALAAAFLFAVWPSGIAITGLAASEPLSLLLFTAAGWFFVLSETDGFGASTLAGISAGLGALARPTGLAMPALWVAYILLCGYRTRKSLGHLALASLFMIITVAPWTLRNYRALGGFVPVSTNGGDVFYRANNPYANGTWTSRGERDTSFLLRDEIQWNRTTFAWGVQWIKANPLAFLKLAVRKQGIFLGEDSTGAYWAVARPYPQRQTLFKICLRISDLWWFTIWVLIVLALANWRDFFACNPRGGFFVLTVLSLVAIHSVFESQDRYHMAAVGFMVVIASLAVARPYPRSPLHTD